jgi:pimeloyl-ACP methyl ester carboxylesterase
MWIKLMPLLAARGYRCVAFDLPGHGESDAAAGEPDLEFYASRIADASADLGLTRYAIVGHHTGASVGLQMAVDHPERVTALVGWGLALLDSAGLQELANEAAPVYDYDAVALIKWWKWRWKSLGSIATGDLTATRVTEMLQTGTGRPLAHHAVGRADHEQLLKRLQVPMLTLAGTSEMLYEETRKAPGVNPRVRFQQLGAAGFDVIDTDTEAFAEATDRFLREAT